MGSVMDQPRPWETEEKKPLKTIKERVDEALRSEFGRWTAVEQIIVELERLESMVIGSAEKSEAVAETPSYVDEDVITAGPSRTDDPIFWYRPVGTDGGYEGPHHSSSKLGQMYRDQMPGQWKPLYARSAPAASRVKSIEWWQTTHGNGTGDAWCAKTDGLGVEYEIRHHPELPQPFVLNIRRNGLVKSGHGTKEEAIFAAQENFEFRVNAFLVDPVQSETE